MNWEMKMGRPANYFIVVTLYFYRTQVPSLPSLSLAFVKFVQFFWICQSRYMDFSRLFNVFLALAKLKFKISRLIQAFAPNKSCRMSQSPLCLLSVGLLAMFGSICPRNFLCLWMQCSYLLLYLTLSLAWRISPAWLLGWSAVGEPD